MDAQDRALLLQAMTEFEGRDMRMSSVFCLNARPSTPMVLPFSTQSVS